jgi:protein TonB
MKTIAVLLMSTVCVAGCTMVEALHDDIFKQSAKKSLDNKPPTTPDGTSTATTLDQYKRALGQRIMEVNSTKVYVVRPQALLRSVIVIRFVVDGQGTLVRSEISRTNHDMTAEATAMAALRSTAPFPKPPSTLLKGGNLEMSETWLFNDDGRFQIRSVALSQIDR